MSDAKKKTHQGSCLCGAVRFEADVDLAEAGSCNCTGCAMSGMVGGMTKAGEVRVTAGADHLARFQRDGKMSARRFCDRCGVTLFSEGDVPEMGGKFQFVNFHALSDFDPTKAKTTYYDARHDNWQAGGRATPWPTHV